MVFLLFLAFVILGAIFSTIKIEVKNLFISNIDKIKIDYDYSVFIKLYGFGFIKFFQIKLDKNKIRNIKLLKNLRLPKINRKVLDFKVGLDKLKPELQIFNLDFKIGTKSIWLTNFVVFVSSICVAFLLRNWAKKFIRKRHKFKIEPIYSETDLVDIKFNCIIKLKMVHIINIIYIVLKKRSGLKDARTSNRRLNDDSYEQYTRYDRRQHNYWGTN